MMTTTDLQERLDRLVAEAHRGNRHAVNVLEIILDETTDDAARRLVKRALREALDEC